MVQQGLLRRYPFFVAFLAAEVACSVVLMRYDLTSRSYAEVYRVCESIITIFRLGVAAELYERICEHFPGIGVFRAVLASILVGLAAMIAIFSSRSNVSPRWAFAQTVTVAVLRFQGEIFAGVFLLTWIFLRYFLSIRQPFRPNVLKHWTIATAYFGAIGATYVAILLTDGGIAVYRINCGMMALQIVCFYAWFRLMRRSGEELPAFPRLSPNQVQAVESYNRELLRTVRSLPGEISARQTENRDIPLHRARLP
jgi:hypothetical protein